MKFPYSAIILLPLFLFRDLVSPAKCNVDTTDPQPNYVHSYGWQTVITWCVGG